jgi:hypothetical protein
MIHNLQYTKHIHILQVPEGEPGILKTLRDRVVFVSLSFSYLFLHR